MIWLKYVDQGATEFWIGDADDVIKDYMDLKTLAQPASRHCAGKIDANASCLKLQNLQDEHEDIAIAVCCHATSNGALYNPNTNASYAGDTYNAIWYTTLRKKITHKMILGNKYIVSPTKFVNALRGTGLESPLNAPRDYDISTSGIVFLARASRNDICGANAY